MGTSGNKISPAPEALSRPSLLSTGASGADHNILDAMPGRGERAEAVARPRRQWWWLLPLVAATAWGISTQLTRPPAVRPVPTAATPPVGLAAPTIAPAAAPVATESPATSTPLATTTVTTPSAGTSSDPFQSLAAAPVVAPTLPASSTQVNPVARLQAAMDAPAALPAPTKTRPLASQDSTTTVAEKKRVTSPAQKAPAVAVRSQDNATTTAARKTPPPTTKTQASTKPPQQAKSSATAPAKTGNRDPDVELLSAIMKHLGDGKGSAAADATNRSPQTIADLVKSCRTKDSIEALLCQRRICEGSWGKAQACPKEQAPKATTAQAPT